MTPSTYLVTGSAGFIGFHLARKLLEQGHRVVGMDNLNDYYSVELKEARTSVLQQNPNYTFYREDFSEREKVLKIFREHSFETVFHLGAQAGVRYSMTC